MPHSTVEEASLVKQGHTVLQGDHIGAQQVLLGSPSHPLHWCIGTVEYSAVMYNTVKYSAVQFSAALRPKMK